MCARSSDMSSYLSNSSSSSSSYVCIVSLVDSSLISAQYSQQHGPRMQQPFAYIGSIESDRRMKSEDKLPRKHVAMSYCLRPVCVMDVHSLILLELSLISADAFPCPVFFSSSVLC